MPTRKSKRQPRAVEGRQKLPCLATSPLPCVGLCVSLTFIDIHAHNLGRCSGDASSDAVQIVRVNGAVNDCEYLALNCNESGQSCNIYKVRFRG